MPSLPAPEAAVPVLLAAYRRGCFPMAAPGPGGGRWIEWFNPAWRAILPLDALHVPDSLRQRVRSGRFDVTCDAAFGSVIRACAETDSRSPGRMETWIDPWIIDAYTALHRAGHAHSVEAWRPGPDGPALVGGLYGVHIGGLFAGESMFSRPAVGGTDASKVCLVHLVAHLRRRGFSLLDAQFPNPHLEQFGAVVISRAEYLRRLALAVDADVQWGEFTAAGAG